MTTKSFLFNLLIAMLLAGCQTTQAAPMPAPTTTLPAPTTSTEPAGTAAQPLTTPTTAIVAAAQITPMFKGTSVGLHAWSPDSGWLPYVDYNTQTLYFYNPISAATCSFPSPIPSTNPNRFLAWLPNGQVIVQTADRVMSGLPCGTFTSANAAEIHVLDQQDPAFAPGGKLQVVFQSRQGGSARAKDSLVIQEAETGKKLTEVSFVDLPRGGSNLPGYWLDATHFLIPATGDQGPLLLTPGQPPIQVAADLFHLPVKPGSGDFDYWQANAAATGNLPTFHITLVGIGSKSVDDPLQIYHAETGQTERLPYTAAQGDFSNDGHWLLIHPTGEQTLIRPIDPPGAALQPFPEQPDIPYRWSPDGSKVIAIANSADKPSTLSLYAMPQYTLLGAWQAEGYEVFPTWSPDGKYLALWGRLYSDLNQSAIFVVPVPSAAP